ncbi:MAG TPA: twin-arginine translocation signal domain-containing protein [Candidatus Eisenbacteria bacterium]|nr:twin-arginine translocation signal domain-containing protein [Candidatus Eisenbacteria bacterium]
MASEDRIATLKSPAAAGEDVDTQPKSAVPRRSFLKGMGVAGVALSAGSLLPEMLNAQAGSPSLTRGDAAILRFLAAAEIIETDLWQQYNEFAGIQDSEVPGGSGNDLYAEAVAQLDEDMAQYIHDNTEDELTHEVFINAYLAAHGAPTVSLDPFRTLPSSKATGAQQIGRLTNLMQLSVDTTWFTRYRSRTKNPDFSDKFPQAIPSLAVGRHPAIPRTDADVQTDSSKPSGISDFTQAIANTAGFHFATIEQGGTSLYPQLAQRVTSVEVLRILLSIGGTEIMHFQTWQDKAGNAPPLADVVDPATGVKVTFPDLNSSPFGGEDFQTNLIMPEPTVFLNKKFPAVSIIRPTATKGAAMGALKALTADGLFIGQSNAFFEFMIQLATEADAAQRGF